MPPPDIQMAGPTPPLLGATFSTAVCLSVLALKAITQPV